MVNERAVLLRDAAFASLLTEFELAGVELPACHILTAGQVAIDCESVYATVQRQPGAVGGDITNEGVEPIRCAFLRAVIIEVGVIRCAPVVTTNEATGVQYAPSPDEQKAFGDAVLQDAALMQSGLYRGWTLGVFGEGPMLAMESWESWGPDGGFGGGNLVIRVGLW